MINELEIGTYTLRLLLALICGGILGVDRGRKKRPAGLRTYMLVCLGAALVMMTNEYICKSFSMGDPTRMGAQVISGIGFLGVGTIIVTGHNRVKGLTTAAGLWTSACIGLAVGIGFYVGAILGTIMIFFVMVVMHSIDKRVSGYTKVISLYVEIDRVTDAGILIRHIKNNNIKITDFEMYHSNVVYETGIAILVTLQMEKKQPHATVINSIGLLRGIKNVEEV